VHSSFYSLRAGFDTVARSANRYDNASCETFHQDAEARRDLREPVPGLRSSAEPHRGFIERYYNQVRLHSALGYRSPEEFEEQAGRENSLTTTGATVRFFSPTGEKASTVLMGEGTETPSLPQAPSCLKNQQNDRMESALLQSVKGEIVSSEGFTFRKAASCSNGKLYQESGSVYGNVDDFVLRKPPTSTNRNSFQ
jgi:hypothetical protein